MDDASISVIGRMMKSTRLNKRCFFIASYRDEISNNHSFLKAVDSSSDFGVTTTKVTLDCVDNSAVNVMISCMLRLSPRLVTSLSDIVYHKSV